MALPTGGNCYLLTQEWMRAYVQVEPINATTSQGVWTRSHECGAYGNICKHFVWVCFFLAIIFETRINSSFKTRWPAMRRPHLVLSFNEASLVRAMEYFAWKIVTSLMFGTFCLKNSHLFGALEHYTLKLWFLWCCVEHYTWKIVTQALIIRCCWRWTRGGC